MQKKIVIRKDQKGYIQQLRDWIGEIRNVELEEMTAFFRARLDTYEEHMSLWSEAYKYMGTKMSQYINFLDTPPHPWYNEYEKRCCR